MQKRKEIGLNRAVRVPAAGGASHMWTQLHIITWSAAYSDTIRWCGGRGYSRPDRIEKE